MGQNTVVGSIICSSWLCVAACQEEYVGSHFRYKCASPRLSAELPEGAMGTRRSRRCRCLCRRCALYWRRNIPRPSARLYVLTNADKLSGASLATPAARNCRGGGLPSGGVLETSRTRKVCGRPPPASHGRRPAASQVHPNHPLSVHGNSAPLARPRPRPLRGRRGSSGPMFPAHHGGCQACTMQNSFPSGLS